MSAPIVYKLKTPIKYGEETVTELEFNKPKAGALRDMRLNLETMGEVLNLAQKCSDKAKVFFDNLEIEDVMGIAEIIAGFFGKSLQTGEKS